MFFLQTKIGANLCKPDKSLKYVKQTLSIINTTMILFAVEEAGGKCLPCAVDIRDEGAVTKAVQEAVKKFGGIDILVNNASAISLTGTLETPMKR